MTTQPENKIIKTYKQVDYELFLPVDSLNESVFEETHVVICECV